MAKSGIVSGKLKGTKKQEVKEVKILDGVNKKDWGKK